MATVCGTSLALYDAGIHVNVDIHVCTCNDNTVIRTGK